MLCVFSKTIIILLLENNMTMFDDVTVTYNIQCRQNGKWTLIFKHDIKCATEANIMLEDCYKLDPNGVYQIVEHWK